jgi:hypothetical protein
MTVVPLVEMLDNLVEAALPSIPDKMYFRVGEVSRLVGVEPYVLRFWETQFPALSPKKSGAGMVMAVKRRSQWFVSVVVDS